MELRGAGGGVPTLGWVQCTSWEGLGLLRVSPAQQLLQELPQKPAEPSPVRWGTRHFL